MTGRILAPMPGVWQHLTASTIPCEVTITIRPKIWPHSYAVEDGQPCPKVAFATPRPPPFAERSRSAASSMLIPVVGSVGPKGELYYIKVA